MCFYYSKSNDEMGSLRLVAVVIYCTLILDHKINGWNKTETLCTYCEGKLYCDSSSSTKCPDGLPCTPGQYDQCMRERDQIKCDGLGVYSIPGDKTRYYNCVINEHTATIRKIMKECPTGYLFSSATLKCMSTKEIEAMKSLNDLIHQSSPYNCLMPGLFEDFRDCKKYYVCQIGDKKALSKYCPPGEFFNNQEGGCSERLSVECAGKMLRKYELHRAIGESLYWETMQHLLQIENSDDLSHARSKRSSGVNMGYTLPVHLFGAVFSAVFSGLEETNISVNNEFDFDDESQFATRRNSHKSSETIEITNHDKEDDAIRLKSSIPDEISAPPFFLITPGGSEEKFTPKMKSLLKTNVDYSKREETNSKFCLSCEMPEFRRSSNRIHNSYDCIEPGYFRDPVDCHKFFYCALSLDESVGLQAKHMTCGRLWFNVEKRNCEEHKPSDCA